MPANARFLLGVAVGYFLVPIVVREFWGIVGNMKNGGGN
jgi:hypothetical protein